MVAIKMLLISQTILPQRRVGLTVLSHKDSIELFDSLGVSMIPELKTPQVPMPFEGDYSQSMYASQMLNDYTSAGISQDRVYPQSFSLDDINHWLRTAPEFAKQAAYLDGRYRDAEFDINVAATWSPSMQELAEEGVRFLASPLWMLLTLDAQQRIVASEYAVAAKTAGLNILAWTVERSGPITTGNNWYYQSIQAAIENEGDVFTAIDILVNDVGVVGVFSDWPATMSYYSHCTE
jgi:glycerophosphoryl diester phosphodiesterase